MVIIYVHELSLTTLTEILLHYEVVAAVMFDCAIVLVLAVVVAVWVFVLLWLV